MKLPFKVSFGVSDELCAEREAVIAKKRYFDAASRVEYEIEGERTETEK